MNLGARQTLSVILIALGLIMDMASLRLAYRYITRGHGASGVPVVPMFLYMSPWFFYMPTVVEIKSDNLVVGLVSFHVMIRYILPLIGHALKSHVKRD